MSGGEDTVVSTWVLMDVLDASMSQQAMQQQPPAPLYTWSVTVANLWFCEDMHHYAAEIVHRMFKGFMPCRHPNLDVNISETKFPVLHEQGMALQVFLQMCHWMRRVNGFCLAWPSEIF